MIDTGDTAWMLTATSLVLFMSPGVAFFYGGLARSKNVVNVLGMTLIVMGLMSVPLSYRRRETLPRAQAL
jgi:Amt family ammonium transporter